MTPQPRPDNLGTIPYTDTADPNPDTLPFCGPCSTGEHADDGIDPLCPCCGKDVTP
jgi:hypothetical protein